jgi:hypothetical protein
MDGTDTKPRPLDSTRVRQIEVPPEARALSTLAHIDYEDAFFVGAMPVRTRTAEQWARAVLEGASLTIRGTLQTGWSALGLKLGRDGSDRFVLGWEVRRSSPDFVLLAAGSHVGMPGELLFKRERGGLLFATFVQHDNAVARGIWAGVEPVHVPIVRRILEDARRRCAP